jgi:hypothetical protein
MRRLDTLRVTILPYSLNAIADLTMPGHNGDLKPDQVIPESARNRLEVGNTKIEQRMVHNPIQHLKRHTWIMVIKRLQLLPATMCR